MVEVGAVKRQHWHGVLVKNFLDTISGAIAFWIIGFGIAFGPTDSKGFIGTDPNSAWVVSAGWNNYTAEDLYLKFIFQFAFANTASAIVGGLITERVRIETYGVFSFLMTLFIYPVIACWVWNPSGWLYVAGFHDFAGCSVVHVVGGASGLICTILAGPRIGRFDKPWLPFIMREKRQAIFDQDIKERLDQVKHLEQCEEIKELVDEGKLSAQDLAHLRAYALNEYQRPNFDLDELSSMWLAIGVFDLWLGWLFFNGGSAYTLYNKAYNPAKIITNTILSGAAAGATVYFVKKPISLFVFRCNQENGKYYKTFRTSQRFDGGSISNGILAGLVAITAACDTVEPWAAIVIGIIGAFLYSLWIRMITELYIDDPIEASGVHYVNGVWGILACIIFESQRGFVSGSPDMGKYLGVQVYGIICVTLWSMFWALLFFLPCRWFGVLKYHPVLEMLGAHRFKMGDITEAFLKEIRQFSKKHDFESGPYLNDDAKKLSGAEDVGPSSSKSSGADHIPNENPSGYNSARRTAKVAQALAVENIA